MSITEKRKKEKKSTIKGTDLQVHAIDTGEFRCIPMAEACSSSERALEMIEVLKKMPKDKQQVWVTRLDVPETLATCPIIREDQSLRKKLEELCNNQNSETKDAKQPKEVKPNE